MVKHDFSPFNLKAIPTEMGEQSCKLIEICRVIPETKCNNIYLHRNRCLGQFINNPRCIDYT